MLFVRVVSMTKVVEYGDGALPHVECYWTSSRDDWGDDTESVRCRQWRDESAWAHGVKWCRR
jgi:hypothetical protein